MNFELGIHGLWIRGCWSNITTVFIGSNFHFFIMPPSTTSLRHAAMILRKHLRKVMDILATDSPNYNHTSFLAACEKTSPAKVLDSGGELMEFFIIAFGESEDSRIMSSATSARPRDRKRVTVTAELKKHFIDQYLLRLV